MPLHDLFEIRMLLSPPRHTRATPKCHFHSAHHLGENTWTQHDRVWHARQTMPCCPNNRSTTIAYAQTTIALEDNNQMSLLRQDEDHNIPFDVGPVATPARLEVVEISTL